MLERGRSDASYQSVSIPRCLRVDVAKLPDRTMLSMSAVLKIASKRNGCAVPHDGVFTRANQSTSMDQPEARICSLPLLLPPLLAWQRVEMKSRLGNTSEYTAIEVLQ